MLEQTEQYIYERAHLAACNALHHVVVPGRLPLLHHEVEFVLEVARLVAMAVEQNRGDLEGLKDEEKRIQACRDAIAADASYDTPELEEYVEGLLAIVLGGSF